MTRYPSEIGFLNLLLAYVEQLGKLVAQTILAFDMSARLIRSKASGALPMAEWVLLNCCITSYGIGLDAAATAGYQDASIVSRRWYVQRRVAVKKVRGSEPHLVNLDGPVRMLVSVSMVVEINGLHDGPIFNPRIVC